MQNEKLLKVMTISTHTLRKEGDMEQGLPDQYWMNFNPHPPQGG